MTRRRQVDSALAVLVIVGLLILMGVVVAWQARAATGVTADWEMNDPGSVRWAPSGTVLVDTGGSHLDGSVGSHVRIGKVGQDTTFAYPNGTVDAYDPARIDYVPAYPALVPGFRDVTVTVRFNTTFAGAGHVVSWGQSPNDMIRMQVSRGRFFCAYQSTEDTVGLDQTEMDGPFNDGRWHTVTCGKVGHRLVMTADGVTVGHPTAVGPLDMRTGISLMGKAFCDGTPGHDCDYYAGHLDFVRVAVS